MHRPLGSTCLFAFCFRAISFVLGTEYPMHLPAHNLDAHTSLLLLLLVVLLELHTPISVGEGTWSHANNTFQKPLRRIRTGGTPSCRHMHVFRERRPLCWAPAVTCLSLVCLVCALVLVLLPLCCCGGCAGRRCIPKAVARALDSLCSKELPVRLPFLVWLLLRSCCFALLWASSSFFLPH